MCLNFFWLNELNAKKQVIKYSKYEQKSNKAGNKKVSILIKHKMIPKVYGEKWIIEMHYNMRFIYKLQRIDTISCLIIKNPHSLKYYLWIMLLWNY